MTTTLRMPPWARDNERLLIVYGVVSVHDLTLDGNFANRGDWDAYEQQQSSLIEARDGSTLTASDLTLLNSPGDGITIRQNVTATLTDITATDCFRGGITQTGDNSTLTIVRYTGGGDIAPAYLNVEASNGVDPENMNLAITDSVFPRVELEAWTGSTVTIDGTTILAGFNLTAEGGGSVTITDTDIGMIEGQALNELRHYVDVTFVRCNFSGARLKLSPEIGAIAPAVQRLTFEDCTFTGTGAVAIFNNGSALAADHLITFTGTNTYSGFAAGYAVDPGKFGATSGSMTAA
jgi:hypothetical protein